MRSTVAGQLSLREHVLLSEPGHARAWTDETLSLQPEANGYSNFTSGGSTSWFDLSHLCHHAVNHVQGNGCMMNPDATAFRVGSVVYQNAQVRCPGQPSEL